MSETMLVFSLPGHERLATQLATALGAITGALTIREFPDGETYVRGETPCEGRETVLAVNLFQPNALILPLLYCADALKVRGARRVLLVSPYLPYMRQDARFQPGEVVTSRIFARLLNDAFDGLVTIDPHLHRYTTLNEIYTISNRVVHAAPTIASWIQANVVHPVIIGPDMESEQWVSSVADMASAPSLVLTKIRHGDRDVEISVPPHEPWIGHTPVLVDDIISTGRTMIETIGLLREAGYAAPVCVGVHAVFAGDAYDGLKRAGAADIVTCNTVPHPTNAIDLTSSLADGVRALRAMDSDLPECPESKL